MTTLKKIAHINVLPRRWDPIVNLIIVITCPIVLFTEWRDFATSPVDHRTPGDLISPFFWTVLFALFIINILTCRYRLLRKNRNTI